MKWLIQGNRIHNRFGMIERYSVEQLPTFYVEAASIYEARIIAKQIMGHGGDDFHVEKAEDLNPPLRHIAYIELGTFEKYNMNMDAHTRAYTANLLVEPHKDSVKVYSHETLIKVRESKELILIEKPQDYWDLPLKYRDGQYPICCMESS